jgi:hypothetical protein
MSERRRRKTFTQTPPTWWRGELLLLPGHDKWRWTEIGADLSEFTCSIYLQDRAPKSDREELQRMYFMVFGICGEEIEMEVNFRWKCCKVVRCVRRSASFFLAPIRDCAPRTNRKPINNCNIIHYNHIDYKLCNKLWIRIRTQRQSQREMGEK